MRIHCPSGKEFNLTARSVEQAYDLIRPLLHKTPILTSTLLSSLSPDLNLYFKAEVFQKTGTFKFRGASHAIARLQSPSKGVVTHSSGNHSAALALAAHLQRVKCHVVMVPPLRVEVV